MKNVSVDRQSDSIGTGPEDVTSSSQSSPRSSVTSSDSLLALGELALDGNRSDETASLSSPTVLEVSVDQSPSGIANGKSVTAKRYPSFRDIFMKQISRGRRLSSVSNTPDGDRSLEKKNPSKKKRKKKKKDKTGGTGCAGWLEKKKKRKNSSGETTGASFSSSAESSNESSDQPPPLVTPREMQEKVVEEQEEENDEQTQYATGSVRGGGTYTKRPTSWTHVDDLDVDSLHLSDPMMIRIASLARLALDVLIRNVSCTYSACPFLPPFFFFKFSCSSHAPVAIVLRLSAGCGVAGPTGQSRFLF